MPDSLRLLSHYSVFWPIPCNSQLEIYLLPLFSCIDLFCCCSCFLFLISILFFQGYPVIFNKTSEVKGSFVVVRWKPCTASLFTVYHREIISEAKSHWKAVNVSGYKTSYNLHLGCRAAYEIVVTAWNSRAETPLTALLNHSRLWRVKTFGGDNSF